MLTDVEESDIEYIHKLAIDTVNELIEKYEENVPLTEITRIEIELPKDQKKFTKDFWESLLKFKYKGFILEPSLQEENVIFVIKSHKS